MITPIFYRGEWVGFSGKLAHKSDIGGPVPVVAGAGAGNLPKALQLLPSKCVQAYLNERRHRSTPRLQQPHAGSSSSRRRQQRVDGVGCSMQGTGLMKTPQWAATSYVGEGQ